MAGAASAVAGTGMGLAALAGGGTSMAGAAVGALVLAPVIAVGGIIRGVNNGKVSREILARHTALPLLADAQQVQSLDLFFPLAPSPLRLELEFELADGSRESMIIDTSEIMKGLHLESDAKPDSDTAATANAGK